VYFIPVLVVFKTARERSPEVKVMAISIKWELNPNPADIRTARLRLACSYSEAAELAQVTPSCWRKWEFGKAPMHVAYWDLFLKRSKLLLSARAIELSEWRAAMTPEDRAYFDAHEQPMTEEEKSRSTRELDGALELDDL
jgi:hypothetical protein